MPEYNATQQAAVDFRGDKLLVSAAAGSGKTRVLVGRVVERIRRDRLDLEDFLIITFTRAAAAELRDRFSSELGKLASSGDRHLRRQLTASKENITTIDAFCSMLVREYAHLTDVAGRRILSQGEIEKLRQQARAAALNRIYSSQDEDLAAAVAAFGYGRADRKFGDAMERVYDHTREHAFPQQWKDKVLAQYSKDDFGDTVFGWELARSAWRLASSGSRLLQRALDLASLDEELFAAVGPTLQDDLECARQACRTLEDGYFYEAHTLLTSSDARFSTPRGKGDDPLKIKLKALRDRWKSKIKPDAAKLISDYHECSDELASQLPVVRGLFKAAEIFGEEFDRIKTSRRAAEFLDYSHAAVELLATPLPDGRCEPSTIARTVAARYKEVLVDEFQDTNELQTLICDLLTAEEGHTLFMVGDVKQSIYRFRLARPEIFLDRYESYPPLADGLPTAVQNLSENFRSRAEVIGPINYFFRRLMTGGASEIRYDAGQYLYPHRNDEPSVDCITEFCIIDGASNTEDGGRMKAAEQTLLEAEYVATRIADMLHEGFLVKDGDTQRPVRPGDIAILLRSHRERSWVYRKALERLGIPCDTAADGGDGEELMTLLAVLSAVDNPYLDVPLIGAMMSPVFGFTPDELAMIRGQFDNESTVYGSVLRAAMAGNAHAAEFVERLGELRRAAGTLTVDKFILRLYAESGLVGVYSATEGGAVRRERLNLAYLAARRYAKQSRYGLHGFVEYLESAIDKGELASTVGGGEGVRVMSVHGSKGLEFPVVFCSSLGVKFNFDDLKGDLLIHPDLGPGVKIFDRDRRYVYPSGAWNAVAERARREMIAEELRILYVAMTRAKDKLILTCTLGDAAKTLENKLVAPWLGEGSLVTAVSAADILIPLAAEHPDGVELRTIAGTDDVCIPEDTDGRMDIRVIGMMRPDGTPRTEALQQAEPPMADREVYETLQHNLSYVYPAPGLAAMPSKLTATQLKGLREDETVDISDEQSEEDEPRRRFIFQKRRPKFLSETLVLTPTERGTAIHTAMQFADYAACSTPEGAIAEVDRLEREKYLTSPQADTVRSEIDKICGFVNSDLCRRAMASDDLRREFKFSLLDDAGRYFPEADQGEQVLLQGVCDLFFREGDGITVVDFKSDRVSVATERGKADDYAPQLDAYGRALERIFGVPVKRRVIYFFATGHEVEV